MKKFLVVFMILGLLLSGCKAITANAQSVTEVIQQINTNTNIYVDYSKGNDTINKGTELLPYKTIQHAINSLVKNLNGKDINIYVVNSSVDQSIEINDFYGGGRITIQSTDGTKIINYISAYNNQITIWIQNFICNGNTDSSVIDFNLCQNVSLVGCSTTIDNNSVDGISFNGNGYIEIVGCTAINKLSGIVVCNGGKASILSCNLSNNGTGIECSTLSQVYSEDNEGDGNDIGMAAYQCSTIGKSGIQPSGVTNEEVDSSSVIR
jgi:uncharacterized protein YceK